MQISLDNLVYPREELEGQATQKKFKWLRSLSLKSQAKREVEAALNWNCGSSVSFSDFTFIVKSPC